MGTFNTPIKGQKTIIWSIYGQPMTEGTYILRLDDTHYSAPKSTHYLCPSCGAKWASATIQDTRHWAIPRPCPLHGPGLLGIHNPAYPLPHSLRVRELRNSVGMTPTQYQSHIISGGI